MSAGEAQALIHDDGSAELVLDGYRQVISAGSVAGARERVRLLLNTHVADTGLAVVLSAEEAGTTHRTRFLPDGSTEPVTDNKSAGLDLNPAEPGEKPANVPMTRREARSFVVPNQAPEEPATVGLRALLVRLGFKVGPGVAEAAERLDRLLVGQHWPGLRVVTSANPKGGSGKTPVVVVLAALFARLGGVGVLAADVNPFRGSLGWRTQQGPHEGTVKDLLTVVDHLLGPGALLAEMSKYVHHQTEDKFDVLRSRPHLLASEQRLTPDSIDQLVSVAGKYYRMLFLDTGNDESDPLFARIIDRTDQLVVPTSTRSEMAEGARLMLEALGDRDEHGKNLAANAVVVVSVADKQTTSTEIDAVREGFTGLCRAVVTVPYDEGLKSGWIKFDALQPGTQRACLAAAAAVAKGFTP